MNSPLTPGEVSRFVHSQFPFLKEVKGGYEGECVDPNHPGDGNSGSMNMSADGTYFCHSGGCKGNLFTVGVAASEVYKIVGRAPLAPVQRITYAYTDENGANLFFKDRVEPGKDRDGHPTKKSFFQYHYDENGKKVNTLEGVRLVLYKLPELLASTGPLYVVEGEKAADKLLKIGVPATCSNAGSMKWDKIDAALLAKCFGDRDLILLPDNDEVGRKGAGGLATLLRGIARSVKILPLPNLPEAGDAFDWIENGGTAEQLRKLADNSPEHAAAEPEEQKPSPLWSPKSLVRLSQRNVPEREWLIEGVLPKRNITMFAAQPGTGKSLLSYAMGQAISRGEDFAGLKTKQCRVLYLDRENPADYWLTEVQGKLFQRDEGDNFIFNLGSDDPEPPELNNQGLIDYVKSLEGELLVMVDSLSKYMIGKNENLAEDVDPWFEQVKVLRNLGASFLISHHMNKAGGIRGSTAIEADVDWAYDLVGTEAAIPHGPDKGRTGLGLLKLNISKGRGAHGNHVFRMNYETHLLEAITATGAKNAVALVTILRENPKGVSQNQLVKLGKGVGVYEKDVREFVRVSLEDGSVYEDGSPNSPNRKLHLREGPQQQDLLP